MHCVRDSPLVPWWTQVLNPEVLPEVLNPEEKS